MGGLSRPERRQPSTWPARLLRFTGVVTLAALAAWVTSVPTSQWITHAPLITHGPLDPSTRAALRRLYPDQGPGFELALLARQGAALSQSNPIQAQQLWKEAQRLKSELRARGVSETLLNWTEAMGAGDSQAPSGPERLSARGASDNPTRREAAYQRWQSLGTLQPSGPDDPVK